MFDVLAEPTRRDILVLLRERSDGLLRDLESQAGAGELSVGDLVSKLGVNQPTVSKHLKVLRDNGLVEVREDAQHRYYRLATKPLQEVVGWLEQLAPDHRAVGHRGGTSPYADLGPAGYQLGQWIGALAQFLSAKTRLFR